MSPLRVVTVVGARPHFVKAAAISRAITSHNEATAARAILEILIHTGQHYDYEMSAVFFAELGLPTPTRNLGVGSGSQGAQTGRTLERVEEVLAEHRPDLVLVYGDTNSTLAGALAAVKLHIPVAHVEAGIRSFNRAMSEEVNRILTDHISTWLFCPSDVAVRNLAREGIEQGVHVVGDVMYDVMRWHLARARRRDVLGRLDLPLTCYALATVHRAENTDVPERLRAIIVALQKLAATGPRVVLPLHPRTRKALDTLGIATTGLDVITPVSYEEMLVLEANAAVILTDSGGVQKEAYWLGVPCVTMRDETEWVETVAAGWNTVVGSDSGRIVEAARQPRPATARRSLYGDGDAGQRIVALLADLP